MFYAFQGIMLVYDITNEKSFENIRNWIRNIEEVCFLVHELFPFCQLLAITYYIKMLSDSQLVTNSTYRFMCIKFYPKL